MKVFTPIMNLVIKTTYETNEAFEAALETRRRGLKLKRKEEEDGDLDFTLHVTQTHINLVRKALGQISEEEPTTSRSLNLFNRTTGSEVEVEAGEQSKPVAKFPSKPKVVGKPESGSLEKSGMTTKFDVQQRDVAGEQDSSEEKSARVQFVEKTEDAIAGLFQQAESVGVELLERAEDAIAGEEVKHPPHEIRRQETLGHGRHENSRFRNRCYEFNENDIVQMKVFTPIMNLVIKTTYETNEAFEVALETRRRGLKLKRKEEEDGDLDFTLHVTQTHINLVRKALGQISEEQQTTSRSLNLLNRTARSEVGFEAGEQSKPAAKLSSRLGVVEVGKVGSSGTTRTTSQPKSRDLNARIEESNFHSTGEDESLTNRIEEDGFNLGVENATVEGDYVIVDYEVEGQTTGEAMDGSLEFVNEGMSYEPVSERKKIKRQESTWTEGVNLSDKLFLKSRIHALNSMVNKVCGEVLIVRTRPHVEDEVEDVPEEVEKQEEEEFQLNSVRVQQFCQVVSGVTHPDIGREGCLDDSACERELVHPRAVYVHLDEYDVDAAVEGPDSAELLQATSLVCRALHNTMDMNERGRPGVEDTEASAKVAEFARDSELSNRVRIFDRLVRRTLQTEGMERSATRKNL